MANIHCWLRHKCTPIQNPPIDYTTQMGKPCKYNLLILPKLTKLGVSVFAKWCWLWTRLYWVPNFYHTEKDTKILFFCSIILHTSQCIIFKNKDRFCLFCWAEDKIKQTWYFKSIGVMMFNTFYCDIKPKHKCH